MTVLVCGGREYQDRAFLWAQLDRLHALFNFTRVIQGGATGADALAKGWALQHGIAMASYPAEWSKYGKGAGPRRNAEMLSDGKPELVVAFPGGNGTADMVRRAGMAGVKVIEFGADGD